jgi:uncharacterized protein (TIGR00369 family)
MNDAGLRLRRATDEEILQEMHSMAKTAGSASRWKLRHPDFGKLNDATMWNAKPYTQWAGIRIVEASGGASLLELDVQDHHRGVGGTESINGAIIAYLHDILQGAAVRSAWDAAHLSLATISLNIQYLRLLNAEKLVTGRGRLVQRGGTVAYGESELLDEAGNVCSTSTGQFRLFRR